MQPPVIRRLEVAVTPITTVATPEDVPDGVNALVEKTPMGHVYRTVTVVVAPRSAADGEHVRSGATGGMVETGSGVAFTDETGFVELC